MSQIDISELSILLIEPSSTQQKIILRLLEQEGISSIETVNSGAEALESIKSYPPDLVISSLYLPDMTATELLGSIKNDHEKTTIPFVLISSETNFSALDPILQSGIAAILPKPFNAEHLTQVLKTSLEFIDPEEINLEHYEAENIRILLVDDSLMARKHITRVLHNMGINKITTANDGKEGADIFGGNSDDFDLIITDYNMPNMNGSELAQYIRKDLGNTFIPILMVTSETNEAVLNQAQLAGVSKIFDKHFEPNKAKEALSELLS